MADQKAIDGLSELNREIERRCPLCAEGTATEPRRDAAGAILWLHPSGDGTVVSCEAADLQPWREIARRASERFERSPGSRSGQEELDRLAESN